MMEIQTPEAFSFQECLRVLGRSELENLHRIKDEAVFKLLKIQGDAVLIKVHPGETNNLQVDCLDNRPPLRTSSAQTLGNLLYPEDKSGIPLII